ncbi:hypothetical protein FRC03_009567 [Tulasnella sp. 419]|nr:hypothetical protein FRC02_009028 [Tulasnella sp. 418]KAG8957976.1 hypothetical protein FRC03_009567 [Tulasnella sp. 419]
MPPVRLSPNQAAIESRRLVSFHDPGIFRYPHPENQVVHPVQVMPAAPRNEIPTANNPINHAIYSDHGKRRIRGIKPEVYYNWEMSKGTTPITGPTEEAAGTVGDVRFHLHNTGTQVWVLQSVTGTSPPRYQWEARNHAARHPALTTHFLSTQNSEFPTWVTWNTITNYASKSRRQKRESTRASPRATTPSPTHDSVPRKGPSTRVRFARGVKNAAA